MIRKIAVALNLAVLITFILLIFFDVNVKGVFKILLPILVLVTPIINLIALNFINRNTVKEILFSKRFKSVLGYTTLVLLVLSAVLMTQGSDNDIYVKTLDRLITKDDTYAGQLNPTKIYVSTEIYPEVFSNKTSGRLSNQAITVIKAYAKNNNIDLNFYDSKTPLEYNELGEVKGGGVRVTFGEIKKHLLFSELDGNIYIANMASGGAIYKFHRWFGGWRIYSSDMSWIS